MRIETDRALLRDFRTEDILAYERYHGDPRYLQFYAPEVGEPGHARKLVEAFMEAARETPRRNFTVAIINRETSELIGCCSLRTAGQQAGRAEFGLELSPNWWGRGLAAEAARAMLEFGFNGLALNEIHCESVTENHRVGPLITKLGFVCVRRRPGRAWMNERGWTYTDWLLTRSAWAASGQQPVAADGDG